MATFWFEERINEILNTDADIQDDLLQIASTMFCSNTTKMLKYIRNYHSVANSSENIAGANLDCQLRFDVVFSHKFLSFSVPTIPTPCLLLQFQSSNVCGQGCIFFNNPPLGEKIKGSKGQGKNQRRVKKKGRVGGKEEKKLSVLIRVNIILFYFWFHLGRNDTIRYKPM